MSEEGPTAEEVEAVARYRRPRFQAGSVSDREIAAFVAGAQWEADRTELDREVLGQIFYRALYDAGVSFPSATVIPEVTNRVVAYLESRGHQ